MTGPKKQDIELSAKHLKLVLENFSAETVLFAAVI